MNWLRKNKKSILLGSFLLLTSFILTLVSSKSSPLYPFQDWVDANAFFTMGKSLFNGKILYKDLFEQKGPTLYLIYGIGYLISNTDFLGVFIIQVIFFSIFLYYAHKIVSLFLNKKYSLFILPILGLLITTSYAYVHGGSAEELMFPFLAYSLFDIIKFLKEGKISNSLIFKNGLMSGLVLTIKYIDLGFWLGWIIVIFIYYLSKKEYKKAIHSGVMFGFGFILPLLIWMVYFLINNGLYDFIYSYFIVNIFLYAETTSISVKITQVFETFMNVLIFNGIIITVLILGFHSFIEEYFNKRFEFYSMYLIFILLIFGVFVGGLSFRYYILIIFPFILFGLVMFAKNSHYLLDKFFKFKYYYMIYLIFYSAIMLFSLFMTKNINSMGVEKDKMVQYKFAEIIIAEDNPTLLNYNSLDIGLYTTTNIVPNIKYFQRQNFDYKRFPENMEEQDKYIKDKRIMFVVYRTVESVETLKTKKGFLFDNYDLVEQQYQYFEGITYNYYLFKVRK